MRIEFRVQGREQEAYQVTFWREGTNLKSSCTCRAGKSRYACKHRFAMLEADVTNLASGNYDDIGALQSLIQGTDVALAYKPVYEALVAQNFIKSLMHITPQQRRKVIDTSASVGALLEGGFAKGNGGANYFDVYSKKLTYLGSVKTKSSVFNTNISQLFPGLSLISATRIDGLIHERSQGIYLAVSDGDIGIALLRDKGLAESVKALKNALID